MNDISSRFIETVRLIDILYCEDTRVTANLLQKLGIQKELRRFDDFTENSLIPEVISKLKNDKNIGLISDAGTPAISDPGFKLIRECVKNNIQIQSISGPSAVLSALLVSGLPTDHFMFFGFLPKTETHVKQEIEKMRKINEIQKTSFIFFESPHRIVKSLDWISEIAPSAKIAVCRELTKMHEEVLRGSASEISSVLSSRHVIKGEITVVLSF